MLYLLGLREKLKSSGNCYHCKRILASEASWCCRELSSGGTAFDSTSTGSFHFSCTFVLCFINCTFALTFIIASRSSYGHVHSFTDTADFFPRLSYSCIKWKCFLIKIHLRARPRKSLSYEELS